MNTIVKEPIKNPARFTGEIKMTESVLNEAINAALEKIDKLWDDVNGEFTTHTSINGLYMPEDNFQAGWNTGFWTGILWLAYEITGDEKYKERALSHIPSFYKRIDEKIGVNHHDMGFLYVPSCVAAYKITGNELAKNAAIKAADHLLTRYIEKGGYIQAWGNVGEQPRLIIDCMNNIPLLFWAASETKDNTYFKKAYNHAKTTIQNIVRKDASTHHTFYFNPDGTPNRGATHQGAGDNSCWARGQAWLISGLPISYRYTKDSSMPELFEKITNYYLNRLPKDFVPFWDLDFTDGDNEPRDSSSAAIAVCGILEMLPFIEDEKLKEIYRSAADKIMYSLFTNYSTKNSSSNGLLLHATYSVPHNRGVDECNIWGCYYYFEALARMYKSINGYW
ncbi:MAG: glycoside hydrolase family 88 protein [Clostridia bacterium]|nr:glycoside hydrolase family 88 protein [Clostridia bacterium]